MYKRLLTAIFSLSSILGLTAQVDPNIRSVTTTEFRSLLETKGIILIDVRTAAEFKESHIAQAKNIDVLKGSFQTEAAKLDTTKRLAVYCKTGRRSKAAAKQLSALGFKVVDLDKGLIDWISKGYQTIP